VSTLQVANVSEPSRGAEHTEALSDRLIDCARSLGQALGFEVVPERFRDCQRSVFFAVRVLYELSALRAELGRFVLPALLALFR
jgi:hypothetical protein